MPELQYTTMSEFLAPGVYVEEIPFGSRAIEGVATSVTGFIGVSGDRAFSPHLASMVDFERSAPPDSSVYLWSAVRGFFDNGGRRCAIAWIPPTGSFAAALETLSGEPVSLVCCPDETVFLNAAAAMTAHCERRKDCFSILQSPQPTVPHATHEPSARSSYAAYYYPWLSVTAADGVTTLTVPPCGHVAGAYVRTDIERGVWKAPAGVPIQGARALSDSIDAAGLDLLARRGIDVLRNEPGHGIVIWAARTTSADTDWKYVNVRRFLIFLEQSLDRGLQWVVFEPHGATLWETVRATIENFLGSVWRSGALLGQTPREAYFVRCDRTTMTQEDIDNGRLVAVVGVAPVKPAEFVIVRITCQRDRNT